MEKVSVPTFRQNDVAEICWALLDTGAPERFFVGQHHVLSNAAAALPVCKALSRMSLYWCTSDEVKPPHTALHLLLTHSHLKLRCLEMTGQTFNGKVSFSIAQYLTNTMTLREQSEVLG